MADQSHEEDGCWIWEGVITKKGYGRVWYRGRFWHTHRLGYTLLVGLIPDGLMPDHLCEVRACWNPAHLDIVTAKENLLRSTKTQARINTDKVQCKRGHENWQRRTQRGGGPQRICRDCMVLGKRARKAGMSIDDYVAQHGAVVVRMKNQYG